MSSIAIWPASLQQPDPDRGSRPSLSTSFFPAPTRRLQNAMRRAFDCVSSRSHKPDHVPSAHRHSLVQPFRVPVQVRVIVAILCLHRTVYGTAARYAEKQFLNGSGYHRTHGCSPGLHNVDRLMPVSVMNFLKRISQIRQGEPADRRNHLHDRRGPAQSMNRQEKYGDAKPDLQACSSMPGRPGND